ncbi:MAG: hypothetical protein A4E70_00711 [Syntrophus sp. PtaU1.Bin005]|nr:MAG: hypothetical protein A4E70_00711 [Syntrophus sp. PtaU1.Bin005]
MLVLRTNKMNAISSPGISDALLILFNLVYFVMTMILTSLFIERIWIGRTQWLILPLIALSLCLFLLHPPLFLHILKAVTGPFSIQGLMVVTGFGVLSGMVMSSL